MKKIIAFIALFFILAVPVYAQGGGDVPPALSELLGRLISEGGEIVLALVVTGLGIAQKYLVSGVRRIFPNDEKTASRITGGLAEITAALTSIATALILAGVAWGIGFVGTIDLAGLLELALGAYVGGFGVHKVNKVGSITQVLKLLTESNGGK